MQKTAYFTIGYLLLSCWGHTAPAADSVKTPADSAAAKTDTSAAKLKEGMAAPTFALPDLTGKQVFLRNFCGKKLRKPWKNKVKHVVVLSFFASWCKPCKKEIPILHEIYEPFKDKPLKVFLINEQDGKKEVKGIVKKEKYTLPVILDMYGVAAKNYDLVDANDAIGLPRLFVIDKNGTIQLINRGFKGQEDDFKKSLTDLLEKLLKE